MKKYKDKSIEDLQIEEIENRINELPDNDPNKKQLLDNFLLLKHGKSVRESCSFLDKIFDKSAKSAKNNDNKNLEYILSDNSFRNLIVGTAFDMMFKCISKTTKNKNNEK